jgi:phosphate transport system substrate-binding protein
MKYPSEQVQTNQNELIWVFHLTNKKPNYIQMKIKTLLLKSIIFLSLIIAGCIGHQSTDETTTRGKIKIGSDEAFRLLIDTEIHTFINSYIHSDIIPLYLSEGEVMQLLLSDSVRLAIVSRTLNENEIEVFKSQKITPKTTKIATDGVAFILNRNNNDTNFTYQTIQSILKGEISSWDKINAKNNAGNISVVFDHNQSGNARFLKETFGLDSFPEYCYAVNNNEEVVNYVEMNPNAIGVIGVNWISDSRDSVTMVFKEKIKVAGVSKKGETDTFFKPYQGYLANGDYPFTRDVYIISREAFTGLGTGFASFIAGEKGQRIILKSGLIPATAPVRLVQVRD